MWRVRMRRETRGGQAVRRSGGQWSGIACVLRRIFGAPDYAAYLEHCRNAGHPARLTEREYVEDFFERKGRTARCC
jgi:uncharacterized short protein YbdD (DUF466 family)